MELRSHKNPWLHIWTKCTIKPGSKLAESKSKNTKNINKCNNLQLSLIGRKLIINQIMLSKIWYLADVETPTNEQG